MRQFVHIILNPAAGNRRHKLVVSVIETLMAAGARVEVSETLRPGHATELASGIVGIGGPDIVVAAGGDGTANEVARGLMGQGIPLGILPAGTANVLAQEIGLPQDPETIVRTILSGPARLIGTGLVDEKVFLLMVGVGFDGQVVHNVPPALKRASGKLAYASQGLWSLAKGPAAPLRLMVDGVAREAAWIVATNARHYGGPYLLAPDEDISRPGLTLILCRERSRAAFIRYFLAINSGRIAQAKGVEVLHPSLVEVFHPEGQPVQIDGDARGSLPIRIEPGKRFLRLVVPESTMVQDPEPLLLPGPRAR